MIDNKDLLKRIKGLFIVSDKDTKASSAASTDSSTNDTSIASATATQRPVSTVSNSDNTPLNEKLIQVLLSAIEQNNLDGFDYLEYRNSLLSLVNVITDEPMRYKSAFEMAKTMGLDKKKLLESAEFYLNVLAGEQKKFLEALENQKSKQIKARVDMIENMEKSLSEKKKLIEQLNNEIETMNNQMADIKQEINEEVQKIETTNKQFVASYQYVAGQISSDVERINKNI